MRAKSLIESSTSAEFTSREDVKQKFTREFGIPADELVVRRSGNVWTVFTTAPDLDVPGVRLYTVAVGRRRSKSGFETVETFQKPAIGISDEELDQRKERAQKAVATHRKIRAAVEAWNTNVDYEGPYGPASAYWEKRPEDEVRQYRLRKDEISESEETGLTGEHIEILSQVFPASEMIDDMIEGDIGVATSYIDWVRQHFERMDFQDWDDIESSSHNDYVPALKEIERILSARQR